MPIFKGEKLSHEPSSDDNPDFGTESAKLRHQESLRRQREKLAENSDPKAERINKTAREILERLNKLTDPKALNADSEPKEQNLFE